MSDAAALPEVGVLYGRRFAAFHKSDRDFFLGFVCACWLGVIMGFMPAVTKRISGQADYPAPLILEIHAMAFCAWLVLLAIQTGLVRKRRMALHMTLGLTAIALIPLMATSALLSEVYTQRFHLTHPPDNLAFFILPIFYVVAFASLASAAILLRRNPGAHKRLMILATTIIVGAAYARWWGDALSGLVGDGYWGMLINTYAGTNLLLAAALVHDLRTRGRLHRIYERVVPWLLAGEVATSYVYHSPAWPPIARGLVGS